MKNSEDQGACGGAVSATAARPPARSAAWQRGLKRRVSLAFLLAGGTSSALMSGCQAEEEPKGSLGGGAGASAGSDSGGKGGASLIPTAGTGANGGNAGAPDQDPDACVELGGLEQCGGASLRAELKIVNLLIVIDKSGSMEDEPAGFGTDKWSALKDALETVLGDVNERVHVGLALYPYSLAGPIPLEDCGGTCCEVPTGQDAVVVDIATPSESGPVILDKLADTSPGGGTPTALALAGALDYFTNGFGATLEGEKFVLLATDGGPNCNEDITCSIDECTPNLDGFCPDDDNCCDNGAGEYCVDEGGVTEQIEALAAEGIATFVVGIPGTDAYADYLDGFALAGGVPNTSGDRDYFAVSASSGVQGLVDVFSDITTDLVTSCEIALETTPQMLDSVNVAVDCEVVEQEGDDGSGWEYDQVPNPAYVILKGSVCEELKANGASRIDVVYGCPTVR